MKRIKKYTIDIIPHKSQNYETVGDYGEKAGLIWVHVSDMKDETRELAVAFHELIEQHLCRLSGIKFKDIDAFDIAYENRRTKGDRHADCGCGIQDEPGNDIHAPYHFQHVFATTLEKQFIGEAAWASYDKKVNDL